MFTLLWACAAIPFALAAPAKVSSITSTQDSFDYVIVGGGLTGLTVASRLSEDPSIRVLVIEGGQDNHDDDRVYDVRTYGQAFESDLDYNMSSTPISWRNGTKLPMVAGKTLGGSGSINGASWTKGPKSQYDLLPLLTGDMSWGWDGLNQYMLGAEHFHTPPNELKSKGAEFDDHKHGYSGPVQVSFAQGMFGSIQQPALNASQQIWGLEHVDDAASGIVNGVTTIPNMVQPDQSQNRSSPYTAYILGEPAERDNLIILTGHRAVEIHWNNACIDAKPGCVLSADGVYYQASRDSERLFVKAAREVLLAAGSMQSPQLLELSGVGDPAILDKAGVPVQKSLMGVGKNLQEQTKNTITYAPKSDDLEGSGPSSAIAFPNVHQLLGNMSSAVQAETLASLASYAANLEAQGLVANATATHEIINYQVTNLFNQSEAAAEIFFTLASKIDSAPATVGADVWNLIPLARGTVHISSNNSFDLPTVEPSYFKHPLDLRLQTLATKQAAQVYSTAPLADMIEKRVLPASELGSYDAWEGFVKNTFTSVWHPISTLSMMKEAMGGVVDNKLKVYGLANVRVVDASVLPVQLSAHLSSSLYGIAERAAAMIKEDQD
ncbi:alcohol oxidase [Aureobasidium sp. EXF-10727]|nr:alcohol oxidase [Aureobasidium sp. EXF-10727]KAI4723851.1 alcohol oxidase [Aureobasidium sp. EXF-10728]